MTERGAELPMEVPFFRPELSEAEIAEVVECLRSGWLTTGPRTSQFESAFAECVGAVEKIGKPVATLLLVQWLILSTQHGLA